MSFITNYWAGMFYYLWKFNMTILLKSMFEIRSHGLLRFNLSYYINNLKWNNVNCECLRTKTTKSEYNKPAVNVILKMILIW